jgi:hypothetical protein
MVSFSKYICPSSLMVFETVNRKKASKLFQDYYVLHTFVSVNIETAELFFKAVRNRRSFSFANKSKMPKGLST